MTVFAAFAFVYVVDDFGGMWLVQTNGCADGVNGARRRSISIFVSPGGSKTGKFLIKRDDRNNQ
ncbi:MAG: hypothetical protein DME49_07850 [Verrucomicrobia bacterium]|nr:MAG: hypothetical protein DME49_07850 [Verrucomicrobiota bacterium]PYK92221.1 MAG: hypothetical protein DME36_14180 [Verrucomicrobiota bacterium]PYL58829.1 MAG: hypothetical protein DMF30_01365 [Verrucomicrobiota bacterium]